VTGFWYGALAGMFAVYVVLDGFDFGAGALHLFVARGDTERRQVLAAIGPVWDGNEVWLIAAGGVLFFAFPQAYAAGFSGFYLPLMLALWLLIGRGLAIELRSHLQDPLWRAFWDAAFCLSSALMAIVLGAALGNVLRGVPLDASGTFQAPWFTNFRVRGHAGVLDWYTILIAAFALAALSLHGALFLAWRTEGPVRERSLRAARVLLPLVAAAGLIAIAATHLVRPEIHESLFRRPWTWPLVALAAAGLAGAFAFRGSRDLLAFCCSAAFLAGTLAATAAGLYPVLLPSTISSNYDVVAASAASGEHGLRVALVWWLLGMALVAGYTTYVYRSMRGKVDVSQGH
jgi:cytochrome d ubiquinol oxidase subunit II